MMELPVHINTNIPIKYKDEIFTEITDRSVPGIIHGRYFISNYGRIYDTYKNDFITLCNSHNGYFQVTLSCENNRITRKSHRIEMIEFNYIQGCEDYKKYQVNHINGNKQENTTFTNNDNLEWCTPKENIAHAINNNLRSSFKGELNPRSKISEKDAILICKLLLDGKSDEYISSVIGCNKSIIFMIANGETWSHLFTESELSTMLSTRRGNFISTEYKHKLCEFFQNNKFKYKKVISMCRDALYCLNLELSERNIRIAKRLYYKYDNPEIGDLYNMSIK